MTKQLLFILCKSETPVLSSLNLKRRRQGDNRVTHKPLHYSHTTKFLPLVRFSVIFNPISNPTISVFKSQYYFFTFLNRSLNSNFRKWDVAVKSGLSGRTKDLRVSTDIFAVLSIQYQQVPASCLIRRHVFKYKCSCVQHGIQSRLRVLSIYVIGHFVLHATGRTVQFFMCFLCFFNIYNL